MTSNEVNILKRYFESKSTHVSIYWLECCLEWFKQQHTSYTENYMCTEVMNQWLETDLRDIEVRSLPNNLTGHKKYILNGNYAVQVMYIKDISRSSYSQLKIIRDMYKLTRSLLEQDENNDPFTTNGTGKRVLSMHLTDGVQYINGFEYQHISSINLYMKPGIKILLIGPLLIRNGEFLLKENNVKILGGEVEDLLVNNSVENVLARELNMPENPNAGKIVNDCEILNENVNNTININNIKNSNISNNVQVDLDFQDFNNTLEEDEIILANLDVFENETNNQTNNSTNNKNNLDSFSDDFFGDMNITNELNKIEQNSWNNIPKQNDNKRNVVELGEIKSSTSTHQDNYDICMEDELELMNRIEEEINLDQNLSNSKINSESETKTNSNENCNNEEFIISPEPFVYIKSLIENSEKLSSNKVYKVKAHFLNVTEKLSVNKARGWTMKFEITDSTGKLTVDFLSTVIEKLMDLSPKEALAENKKVKNRLSQSHEKLSQALKKCKDKLELEYIMHLQFIIDSQHPTIIQLETINRKHLEQLKQRVDSFPVQIL